ncbi:hypothetical protein HMF8227_02442 [Saliniradius amylolyticus]|uniref:HDOD domain-containing protein n=1 Tax=Saliniradius amylolyticus TaxID=2183582 RepID=A0A2S2E5F9_9ALTE|nr:HDOD domain-containing protein [Saliniradius amylolyticus]AWL12894.1 hypothetical protein HMF8227_02442 [Saliniradius amylolyticus]
MISEQQIAEYASHSFTLPDTCNKLRSMLDDDNTDMDDIARVIALDPALSSKLLKLANSSLFRFPSAVSSISKALNIIGGEAMYNLALVETANSAFKHFASPGIDLVRFWKQSVYCALIAKHLGKHCRIRGSEYLFTIGLLHQLAEVVVAKMDPEVAQQCQNLEEEQKPWERQKEMLGATYAECSAAILRHWQLPEQFCYVLSNNHNFAKALDNKEVAILYLSARLALPMADPSFSQKMGMNEDLMNTLALESYDITNITRLVTMEASQLLAIMNPENFQPTEE